MTKLYVLFFVTLIIFIIITEFISFHYVSRADMHILKINFNVFGITYIYDRKEKKKKKKHKLPRPSLGIILSFLKSIIAKSSIEINTLNWDISYETPSEYGINVCKLLDSR